MRKIISVSIVAIVLAGLVSTPMVCGDQIRASPRVKASAITYDELDQSQPVYVNGTIVPVGRISIFGHVLTLLIAQSFVPTKEVLTRVELYMGKNATASYPLVVGIRDNLTHQNLVETHLGPDHFTGNLTWIEFDFEALWVNPGQTYFIVCATKNATDNYYGWAASNHSDAYPNGVAYYSIDNGSSWQDSASVMQPQTPSDFKAQQRADNGSFDMCFKTYGLRETALNLTFISAFLTPKITITNVGNVTAQNPICTVTIQGGFFKKVNYTWSGSQAELQPGDSMLVKLRLMTGFGFITITVTASAINARPVTITKDGFLLLFFLILKK
jgi:hypothetical protein